MTASVPALPTLSQNDKQEYRAYLQRAETRLSTLHRVAGAFLSGAGLLTVLPVLLSNTFALLLGLIVFYPAKGLPPAASAERWLVLVPALASITLPLWALYLLIRDLILFYFTARTFRYDAKGRVYPRFILSGIMVSKQSLDHSGVLEDAEENEYIANLLVPRPRELRRRLLDEAHAVGDLRWLSVDDDKDVVTNELLDFVLKQTASDVRSLPQEAAKMQASIARHQRLLRGLVLRYAKAFLLVIVTTVASIVAEGVLSLVKPLDGQYLPSVNGAYVWGAVILAYATWGLVAAVIVRRPVAWLYSDVENTEGTRTPQALLWFERITLGTVLVTVVCLFVDVIFFVNRRASGGVTWVESTIMIAILVSAVVVSVKGFVSERPAQASQGRG